MKMKRLGVIVAVALMVSSSWLIGQDKGTAKAKGQLPTNWSKLGLTDEQKQKVYETQTAARGKIEALQKQIADAKEQEKKDLENILTSAQKARLREILTSKAPADDTKEKKDSKDK